MSAADKPLQDKTLVNTRAVHQAGIFDTLIRERGGISLAYPCIAIHPPEETGELDSNLKKLLDGNFDWLVLTSANTILSLSERLQALDLSLSGSLPFKTAVVGSSTAEAAQSELNLQVDLIPDEFIAESLAETLLRRGANHIFLPESAIARPTLAQHLTKGGADVTAITAYETVQGHGGVDLPRYITESRVDMLTFTSSSTVDHFVARLHDEHNGDLSYKHIPAACIGPKTAKTANSHGFETIIIPDDYTLIGLLDAIETVVYGSQAL